MIYRYYSTLRPISIGTTPPAAVFDNIVNFDRRQRVPEIDREAWGYFESTAPLSIRACDDCDLVYWEDFPWTDKNPERLRRWTRLNLLSDTRRWAAVRQEMLERGFSETEEEAEAASLGILWDLDKYWERRYITEDDYRDLCTVIFDGFNWEAIRPSVRLRKEKK